MMRGGFLLLAAMVGIGIVAEAYLLVKPALHVVIVSMAAIGLFAFCLQRPYRQALLWRATVIATVMPLLAWSLPVLWLLFLLLGLGVPLVARRFDMVVPVYLFSLLLLPGLESSIMIGPLKLVDFSLHDALAVGAGVTIRFGGGRARPHPRSDIAAWSVILLLGMALARETSLSNHLRSALNVLIDLGLPYYILSRGIRTMEELRAAMLWMGCGAVTLAALLAYELVKTWPIYNILYAQYDLPTLVSAKMRGGYLRAGGPFTEPTSAAMVLAVCIVSLWLCRRYFRSAWHHLLPLGVAMAGLFAPQSRGAWIGLILALACADLFRSRYLPLARKAFLVAGSVSILVLAAEISSGVSDRLGLSGDASDTSDYRRMLFEKGMSAFRDRPVLGYSVPELNYRLAELRQGEGIIDFVNSYIWIMLISGTVGLAIFVGAFLYYAGSLWTARRGAGTSHDGREAATFLFASLCMMQEMLFFTSFGTRPAMFVFIVFGCSTAYMGIARAGRRAPSPPGAVPAIAA
ncbi:MAG: O-antigen ligase family protein [Sphingobium sp.]